MSHVFEIWMLVMLGCLLFCCTLMMVGVTIAGVCVLARISCVRPGTIGGDDDRVFDWAADRHAGDRRARLFREGRVMPRAWRPSARCCSCPSRRSGRGMRRITDAWADGKYCVASATLSTRIRWPAPTTASGLGCGSVRAAGVSTRSWPTCATRGIVRGSGGAASWSS